MLIHGSRCEPHAMHGARHPQHISTQVSPHRRPEARTSASWRHRADVLIRRARMPPGKGRAGHSRPPVGSLAAGGPIPENGFSWRPNPKSIAAAQCGEVAPLRRNCAAPSIECRAACNRSHLFGEEQVCSSHVGRTDAGTAADTKDRYGAVPAISFRGSRIQSCRTNVTWWKAIGSPVNRQRGMP